MPAGSHPVGRLPAMGVQAFRRGGGAGPIGIGAGEKIFVSGTSTGKTNVGVESAGGSGGESRARGAAWITAGSSLAAVPLVVTALAAEVLASSVWPCGPLGASLFLRRAGVRNVESVQPRGLDGLECGGTRGM